MAQDNDTNGVKEVIEDGKLTGKDTETDETVPLQRGPMSIESIGTRNLLKTTTNPREVFAARGYTHNDLQFEDLSQWTAGAGSISAYTSDPFAGTQSVKLENDARADYTFGSAKDFSGMSPTLTVKIPDTVTTADDFVVRLFDSSGNQVVFRRRVNPEFEAGEWQQIALGARTESSTPPDLTDITEIKVRGLFSECYVDNVRLTPNGDDPKVVWRFDDGTDDQLNFADSLDKYGQTGNFAVHTDRIGDSGFLSEADLSELTPRHEICNHLRTDSDDLSTFSVSEARTAIEESKNYLLERGHRDGARTIVYPGGKYSAEVLDVVAEYHELGIGINGRGQPLGLTDPTLMGAYPGNQTVSTLTSEIDFAQKYGQTLVIYLHDTTELSQSDFESVCQHIADNQIRTAKFSTLIDQMRATA